MNVNRRLILAGAKRSAPSAISAFKSAHRFQAIALPGGYVREGTMRSFIDR